MVSNQNTCKNFDDVKFLILGFAGNVSAGEQVELQPPESPMGENSYQSPLVARPVSNSHCYAMDWGYKPYVLLTHSIHKHPTLCNICEVYKLCQWAEFALLGQKWFLLREGVQKKLLF